MGCTSLALAGVAMALHTWGADDLSSWGWSICPWPWMLMCPVSLDIGCMGLPNVDQLYPKQERDEPPMQERANKPTPVSHATHCSRGSASRVAPF